MAALMCNYLITYIFSAVSQKKSVIANCEKYDIARQESKEIHNLDKYLTAYGACCHMSKIYMYGGNSTNGKRSDEFLQYNILKDTWEHSDLS